MMQAEANADLHSRANETEQDAAHNRGGRVQELSRRNGGRIPTDQRRLALKVFFSRKPEFW
jgi:hypothetical protein